MQFSKNFDFSETLVNSELVKKFPIKVLKYSTEMETRPEFFRRLHDLSRHFSEYICSLLDLRDKNLCSVELVSNFFSAALFYPSDLFFFYDCLALTCPTEGYGIQPQNCQNSVPVRDLANRELKEILTSAAMKPSQGCMVGIPQK